ncbi:MAG: glycoside hydrolase [Actinomycetota bacterium]|nr:glycoside hydrolase [Actinomycetota bacterium]
MKVTRELALVGAIAVAATMASTVPSQAGLGIAHSHHARVAASKGAIKFAYPSVVDVQRLGAEPELKIDSKNNVYVTAPIGVQYATSFLWKSEDHGLSYDLLRAFPPLQRPNPSGASGDATIAVVPPAPGSKEDAILWSDLVNLTGLQNVASFDGGNTFPPDYWNEYATRPGADRQWVAGMNIPGQKTARIYQWYDNLDVNGDSVIYTDDYGKTWQDGQLGIVSGPNPGNMAVDPKHQRVYVTWGDGSAVHVAGAGADAKNFKDVTVATGAGEVSTLFTVVAVDTAGNPYVVWAQTGGDRGVYLSASKDQGATWSAPVHVNTPDLKDNIFPWVSAGDPGRVWVTWYGTHNDKAAPDDRGPWNVYAAQSLDALDGSSSSWRVVQVTAHPNHDNEVCLSGIACTAGQGEDRNMLDDFSSAIDTRGMLHIAYNDTNNQLTASTADPDASGAFIMHSVQTTGPSLYKKVGVVKRHLAKPRIVRAAYKKGRLTASGKFRLPAKNWSRDKKNDSPDPRHGPTCPCKSDPTLDVTKTWFTYPKKGADKGSLVAHLQVNNLPPEGQNAGQTHVYQVEFWHDASVYFALLQEPGGTGRAYAGAPGFVPSQSGIAKIATYEEDPSRTKEITYKYVASKKGKGQNAKLKPGRIDLVIPPDAVGAPKVGDELYQVTGLVQTLDGPIGPDSLMAERDEAPAFSWNVGARRRPVGKVQVSIDDPKFSHPITAKLRGYPHPRWGLSLERALTHGKHVIYVRTFAKGARSRSVKVTFKA